MNPKSESSLPDQKKILDSGKQLNELISRRDDLNNKYKSSIAERRGWLVFGLLVSVLMPIYVLRIARSMGGGKFVFLRGILGEERTDFQLTLVLMALSAILALMPALFHHFKARGIKKDLTDIETNIEETYLLSPTLRLKYFQKQFLRLSSNSIRLNWIDNSRRKPSEELRLSIGNILSKLEDRRASSRSEKMKPGVVIPEWDDAQFLLAQWEELLQDEERELIGERYWTIGSIGIALFYLSLLGLATSVYKTAKDIFGVPFPIIIWSGIGSFAAILYRFYKSPRRINLEIELRWLFARPLIGIVMGALAYLALVAGLFIFGGSQADPSPDAPQDKGVLIQFLIIAFLAGFSDKFYEKVIELLVGKFGVGSGNEVDSFVEKTESKVEVITQKKE